MTSLIQCIQKCIQEFYYLLLSVFITWTPVSFVLRNSIIWSLYLLVTDITIPLASLAKNDIDSLKLLTNATFSQAILITCEFPLFISTPLSSRVIIDVLSSSFVPELYPNSVPKEIFYSSSVDILNTSLSSCSLIRLSFWEQTATPYTFIPFWLM